MMSRDKHSLEFTTTRRLFMKIFRTGSSEVVVVVECQRSFNFMQIKLQLIVRTAKFLQSLTAAVNTLCLLFERQVLNQLKCIFLCMSTCTRLVSSEMLYVNNSCLALDCCTLTSIYSVV